VTEHAGSRRIVLAPAAQGDIRQALLWSRERFGERAAVRYRELLKQAICDIAAEPRQPGSLARPELAPGIRTCHLFFSRDRVSGESPGVRQPRHLLVYRGRGRDTLDIVRVLHEARDLERHLPDVDRSTSDEA